MFSRAPLPFWAALALAGCASSTELETVGQERGVIGAHYEMDVAGTNYGDVRVWSEGAHPLESEGGQPVARFEIRIRNDSDGPIRLELERTELEVATEKHELRRAEAPRLEGDVTEVEAGETRHITLSFALPVDASAIDAVELSWVVSTPAGPFSQSTPFVPAKDADGEKTRVIYETPRPWYPYGRRPILRRPIWWW